MRGSSLLSALCVLWLSGCPLQNKTGALAGTEITTTGVGVADTTCISYTDFQASIQPILAASCASCHSNASTSSPNFVLTGHSPYSDNDTIANYLASAHETIFDGSDVSSNSKLVRYPKGFAGHVNILSLNDEATIESWIDNDLSAVCHP